MSTFVRYLACTFFALLACTSVSRADWQLERLKSFGVASQSEGLLVSGLIEASNGFLYGTARTGGQENRGVIFRLDSSGSNYSVVCILSATNHGAKAPSAALLQAPDGRLYGTSTLGGSNDLGTVFHLNPDGSDFAVIHHFGNGLDGQMPVASLILDSAGFLYGTTSAGGSDSAGIVFKLHRNGSQYSVLHHFANAGNDGEFPKAALLEGSDGMLYGTTSAGGLDGVGAAFRLNKGGTAYEVIRNFFSTDFDSQMPLAALLEGPDGFLYGTASAGGSNEVGTVFRMNKQGGAYAVIHDFEFGADGQAPAAPLLKGVDGFLYGTASIGGSRFGGALFKLNTNGSIYTLLYNFGAPTDGRVPLAPLIQGADGRLYGTTSAGGGKSGNATDGGAVFAVATNGIGYTVLHSFSRTGGDAQSPNSLIRANDGMLYGTTLAGGDFGGGTVFRVSTNGSNYSILRHFQYTNVLVGSEQILPSRLLEGADGSLYGTTQFGGTAGVGTIYRVQRDGSGFTLLKSFTRLTSDGRNPVAGLFQDDDGVLYGTTQFGGSGNSGTIFRIQTNGAGFALLWQFTQAGTNGFFPTSAVCEGTDGMLYGLTSSGGAFTQGVAFKVSKTGSGYSVLHSFGASGDGANPVSDLLPASDGLLYGITSRGGTNNNGTIYRCANDGSVYSILRSFSPSNSIGANPTDFIEAADGKLYGTTSTGGLNGAGTLFRMNKDGSASEALHSFPASADDGLNPSGGLLQSDGAFYGATANGGGLNLGLIYRVTETISIPIVLHIHQEGSAAVISWPVTSGAGSVEQADSLNPPQWDPIDPEISISDGHYRALLPLNGGPAFFRVRAL